MYRDKTRVRWTIYLLALAALLVTGCLNPYLLDFATGFLAALFLGWVPFVSRAAAEMEVSWSGIGMAMTCVAGLSLGLHLFCGWLHGEIARKRNLQLTREPRWQWRWTLSLVATVVLMFVAGIAAVGLTHQTMWLVQSPEPIVLRDAWRKGSESPPTARKKPAQPKTAPNATNSSDK